MDRCEAAAADAVSELEDSYLGVMAVYYNDPLDLRYMLAAVDRSLEPLLVEAVASLLVHEELSELRTSRQDLRQVCDLLSDCYKAVLVVGFVQYGDDLASRLVTSDAFDKLSADERRSLGCELAFLFDGGDTEAVVWN